MGYNQVLTSCHYCRSAIDMNASVCPYCRSNTWGKQYNEPANNNNNDNSNYDGSIGPIGGYILFFVIAVFVMLFFDLYYGTTSLESTWNFIYMILGWIWIVITSLWSIVVWIFSCIDWVIRLFV